MAYAVPSGSFVHAAYYASLWLQVTEHLFPGQKFFALSQDQRRIVDNEARALLVQARWVVDSRQFAESFGSPQFGAPSLPPDGTILGAPLAPQPAQPPPLPQAAQPGQYV